MKRYGSVVYIFDVWRSPVSFHRWQKNNTTKCGRRIWDRTGYADAKPFPPRIAVKFARPCSKCYPKESA